MTVMHMTEQAMKKALELKYNHNESGSVPLLCGIKWPGNHAINTGGFDFDDGGFFYKHKLNGEKKYEKVTCPKCIEVLKSKGL